MFKIVCETTVNATEDPQTFYCRLSYLGIGIKIIFIAEAFVAPGSVK